MVWGFDRKPASEGVYPLTKVTMMRSEEGVGGGGLLTAVCCVQGVMQPKQTSSLFL